MWRIEIRNIATVTCDVEIAIDHENLPETFRPWATKPVREIRPAKCGINGGSRDALGWIDACARSAGNTAL